MPVTAKLSRKFYETFGDELTNELVDWLNQVDVAYRTELRSLNESNFARFDAKLEQRLAEYDAKWEKRMAHVDAQWKTQLAQVDTEWKTQFAGLRTEIHAFRADLIKWMFIFWAGYTLTMLGALVALLKL